MGTNFLNLDEVEAIARRAHAGQVDKAGRPYAEHLAAVAENARQRQATEEQIAAAWLHDSVEDDALTQEWLEAAALPQLVKDIVLAMTKRPGEPLEAYAARILAVPEAVLVKDADVTHNSDPERLAVLDEPVRARLSAKYTYMTQLLHPEGVGDTPASGTGA